MMSPEEEAAMAEQMGHQQHVEIAELVKADLLNLYKDNCTEANIEPHEAFCAYLEETYDENDAIDIVI